MHIAMKYLTKPTDINKNPGRITASSPDFQKYHLLREYPSIEIIKTEYHRYRAISFLGESIFILILNKMHVIKPTRANPESTRKTY